MNVKLCDRACANRSKWSMQSHRHSIVVILEFSSERGLKMKLDLAVYENV